MNADLRLSASKNFDGSLARRRILPELLKDQVHALFCEAAIRRQFSADDREQIWKLRVLANEVPARDALFVFVTRDRKRSYTRISIENVVAREMSARQSKIGFR
jgi:hypothetical protein